ncbi:DJ-1/PfpI family protein [Sneathiella sp. P13V-1]|uniref:DJ-1/PfpI family protein n=1 Tax=Sneathiella sp. P13V-1 TaxID=2697366 RepID=UPI00187B191A|nr:DJ-1/PfpI family protein [Sneathiella sp. P13V-1]MBE7636215.1 DJ-1/PfpI family protein [Sneathiella sp. P13V-1]
MKLSIFLYDGLTTLDVVGGYEVLSRVPNMETEFFAKEPSLIAADTRRLGLAAWKGFSDVTETDILYVPGGPGAELVKQDESSLQKLRDLDASSTWTVGICNGVDLLGAAGLITNRTVTTNFFHRDRVAKNYSANVKPVRFYRDEKYITGAGVSASIETGLYLTSLIAGKSVAKTLQLGIEYYPAPQYLETKPEDAPEYSQQAIAAFEERGGVKQIQQKPPFAGSVTSVS